MKKFKQMVAAQRGDISFIENPNKYPSSKHAVEIRSTEGGIIERVDALMIGVLAVELGAGRMKMDDGIDPKAGIQLYKKAGERVNPGDLLAVLHTDKKEVVQTVAQRIKQSFAIVEGGAPSIRPIHAMVDEGGVHPWHPIRSS